MAKPKKITVKYDEIGASGTQIVNGFIYNEEYNRKLVGLAGMKIYDEMRRSDSTVHQLLWAVKYPILGCDWFVEPASDSKEDEDIAQFVRTNLFEILKWKKCLEEALTFLDFGHAVQEMVFEPQDVDGVLRVVLSKLGFRKQTTILNWATDNDQPGITQYTVTNGTVSIPDKKLVRYTLQQEGDNYMGISILRSAYKHWFYKDKYYKIDAIGYERQAVGVPYAKYPASGAGKTEKDEVKSLLRNMRSNQEAYMLSPISWEVGFMDMGARGTKDVNPGIDHHDTQILKTGFAQFFALGATKSGSGSRAVSADHSKFFELAEEAVADIITEVLNDVVIKTLVDLNFTVTEYPKIGHGGIGDEDIQVLSDAISKFVAASALKARPEDENMVRKMVGWPELTEEELKVRKDELEQAKQQQQQMQDQALQDQQNPQSPPNSKGKPVDKNAKDTELNASALVEDAKDLNDKLTRILYAAESGQAA